MSIEAFGETLRDFRRRRRISQQVLAQKLGVHRNTIGAWEQGNYLPESKSVVLELARLLELSDAEVRQLLEASLTTSAPYWSVPNHRNAFFTGREALLDTLHQLLHVDQAAAFTRSYALYGLGGIGKTQIALEYAYRYGLEYSATFWIEAETLESVLASMCRIAVCLELPERGDPDQQRIVLAVQRWLTTSGTWLLIWDNLEDPELLQRFLPSARRGAVLITTRRQALGTLAQSVELPPMTPEEGTVFVLRRAKILQVDPNWEQLSHESRHLSPEWGAAAELVRVMGGLPLALDQAGAYIEETQCNLEDYLHRYQQRQAGFLARRGGSSKDHPTSVATTLSLSFQQVAQKSATAADLLRIYAYLAPDAIPEEVIVQGAAHLGPSFQAIALDPWLLDEAMAVLGTYALVRRNQTTRTLSIHRLVQTVLQDFMTEEERALWLQRVIAALNAVFPASEYTTWAQCERLLAHALWCLEQAGSHAESLELSELASKAAEYLRNHERDAEAESLFQRAIHIREQACALEDSQLALSLSGLAYLYKGQGKYAEAESLFQRSIRIWEQVCALEDSQNTPPLGMAYSLSGLAILFSEQSKYAESESLFQRALRIREDALGPQHFQVAYLLNSMALLSHWQGKDREAEQQYQRAIRIWEQTLGPENPGAADAFTGLAYVYYAQGKNEEMESLLRRAIHIWEQTLGPQHPQVFYPLLGLARLASIQGHYGEAEHMYQRLNHIQEQVLAPDDPRTGYLLEDLAGFHHAQGRDVEAQDLYHRALAFWERLLGPEHPQFAHALHGLARFFQDQGQYEQALASFQRALQIRELRLGRDHPETTQTLHDLALLHTLQVNTPACSS